MRLSIRVLGVISTIILARLLAPADYGLIAIATAFAAAVELLSAFNFDIWLIRHPDPDREHYDTIWTLSICRGVLTALLLWLAAAPLGEFYDDSRLADVLRLIAAGTLVSSFTNVGILNFQRDMRFSMDFLFNASVKIGAFVVTVTLGFIWRNYWALAAGMVTSNVLNLALSYWMHGYRPRLSLSRAAEAFDFSKWLLVGSVLSFIHLRADTFILGKLTGNSTLGLYNVAREIANLATTEFVMPIRRVMLPGYSRLQDDLGQLRHYFVVGFGLIMLIGAPCAVGLSIVADPLIRVMLGQQWLDAIPIMQALVVYGLSMVGLANQWPTLLALGRPRIASALLALGLLLLLPSLYFASKEYGAVGAAFALGVTNTFLFMAGLVAVHRLLRFAWLALWNEVWRTITATALMAAAVWNLQSAIAANGLHAGVTLISCVVVGATTYLVALYFLVTISNPDEGPERAVLNFIRSKIVKSA